MRALLMGGQACVFYGAAEFSRDVDLLILADAANLAKLDEAIAALDAQVIAVPPLEMRYLLRGHAIHLRCHRQDVAGLRIDIMSALRGGSDFEALWTRRTTIAVDGENIDLLGLEDLVRAKKTQRDKDWPMIRRLVEQSYFERSGYTPDDLVRFWLRESRTPEILFEVAAAYPDLARAEAASRPAVFAALSGRTDDVMAALQAEELQERQADRHYWAPLKHELEQLRLSRRGKPATSPTDKVT